MLLAGPCIVYIMYLLFQCDCQVPIVFDVAALASMEDKYRGIHTYLTPELLQRIRTYLSHVQLLAYVVPDDVQKVSMSSWAPTTVFLSTAFIQNNVVVRCSSLLLLIMYLRQCMFSK